VPGHFYVFEKALKTAAKLPSLPADAKQSKAVEHIDQAVVVAINQKLALARTSA